jgi:hypothetical protein
MPKIKGNTSRPICSALRSRTCSGPSSSPTSTTSAASIADWRIRQRTGSCARGPYVPGVHRVLAPRGAVAAAMNVNQWDDGDALQELVDTGRQVTDKELLA